MPEGVLDEQRPAPAWPMRFLGRRGNLLIDNVLAGFIIVFSLLNASLGTTMLLVGLAQSVPLLFRRRRPVLVFGLVALASAVQVFVSNQPAPSQLAFPVAVYSISRFSGARAGWVGLGVGVLASVTAAYDWSFNASPDGRVNLAGLITMAITLGAIVVTSWALGVAGRQRDDYNAWLVERGDKMAEASAQQARLAAADERARIAREMHDVVAHGLSVMVVQADGARYAAERDPQVGIDTLGRVADTGRQSLDEMRRLLGLLRGDDPAAELVPQPTLADLSSLIDQSRETGMDVQASLPPADADVSPGTALTIYRVVQEALTNVRKHAGANPHVDVTVDIISAAAWLRVIDDGNGASAQEHQGYGLIGMRERVEIHDGNLDVGPAPGGGWLVRARIPL